MNSIKFSYMGSETYQKSARKQIKRAVRSYGPNSSEER